MKLHAYSSLHDGRVVSKYAPNRADTEVTVYVFGDNGFVSLAAEDDEYNCSLVLLDDGLVDDLIAALQKAQAFLRERRQAK